MSRNAQTKHLNNKLINSSKSRLRERLSKLLSVRNFFTISAHKGVMFVVELIAQKIQQSAYTMSRKKPGQYCYLVYTYSNLSLSNKKSMNHKVQRLCTSITVKHWIQHNTFDAETNVACSQCDMSSSAPAFTHTVTPSDTIPSLTKWWRR